MIINNNILSHKNLHQTLQQQIHRLNQHFISWKIMTTQLPYSSTLPSQHLIPQVCQKLDQIHYIIVQFCRNFECQLKSIHEKSVILGNFNKPVIRGNDNQHKNDEQRYKTVTNKIQSLQMNLKRTQDSEKKLENTLNYMLKRYDEIEQTKINKEQPNQVLKFYKSQSEDDNLLNCGGSQNKQKKENKSKDKIQTCGFNKYKNKIQLVHQASSHLDYSIQSHQLTATRPRLETQIKLLSQNDQKVSLKNTGVRPSLTDQRVSFMSRGSETSRSSRQFSMDLNEHRMRFMMQKLGQ